MKTQFLMKTKSELTALLESILLTAIQGLTILGGLMIGGLI